MEAYKSFIRSLSERKENRVFLNSDKEHAVAVLTEIFRSSENIVRIFAASLCKEIGNDPEYIEALSDFIERGGEVRILLNRYKPEEVKTSNLFKRLAYYESLDKKVTVKRTDKVFFRSNDPDKKEVHFTLGDEHAYRIENDIDKRTASCNLNDPDLVKGMISIYDELFDRPETETVRVLSLFD